MTLPWKSVSQLMVSWEQQWLSVCLAQTSTFQLQLGPAIHFKAIAWEPLERRIAPTDCSLASHLGFLARLSGFSGCNCGCLWRANAHYCASIRPVAIEAVILSHSRPERMPFVTCDIVKKQRRRATRTPLWAPLVSKTPKWFVRVAPAARRFSTNYSAPPPERAVSSCGRGRPATKAGLQRIHGEPTSAIPTGRWIEIEMEWMEPRVD